MRGGRYLYVASSACPDAIARGADLGALAAAYGYDILRRLRAAGLADVGDASVYGTLRRLYAAGALTSYMVPSDAGPARRYYGITDLGRQQLVEAQATWQEFSRALSALLAVDAKETT
jgi:PadR family transcriptional regulator, regulatory protein PadR